MRILGGETVQTYYLHIPAHIKSEVDMTSDDYILGVDEEEYANHLFEKYSLEPIEKDDTRKLTIEEKKEWRDVDGYMGTSRVEVIKFRIGYPIKVTDKVDEVFEKEWNFVSMRAHDWILDASGGYIYAVIDNSQDAIRNEVNLIENGVSNKNHLIQEQNPQLREKIKGFIAERKKKVKQDSDTFKKLVKEIDIPLEVLNKNKVKTVDFGIKHKIKELIPPQPKVTENYVLDGKKVITILEIIDNVASNFEVAPETYITLEEEKLRNIILSSLNSVFQGKATGETFRKKGKTDILLNIAKGCILVMECKWWSGKKALTEAEEQILKYLTWRENYGVVILFSKNKGFTSVLEAVKDSVQKLGSYSKGFRQITDSHFESQHIFPDDENKTIEIHTLVYNLYDK